MDMSMMRTVVLASADAGLRQRLRASLTGLRWQVREAGGGAEAMAFLEESRPEAMLVDSWLPDLEVGEFAGQIRQMYPAMELLRVDGATESGGARSPRRNELLHALREAQEAPMTDTAAWAAAPVSVPMYGGGASSLRVAEMAVRVRQPVGVLMELGQCEAREAVAEVPVQRARGNASRAGGIECADAGVGWADSDGGSAVDDGFD